MVDENDNPPIFSHTEYTYLLPENSPPGTPLSPVLTATDADSGENAVITYSISGGPFTVDTSTGKNMAHALLFSYEYIKNFQCVL